MPSGSRFKVASKREQNKFIYYVEREQLRRSQDRKAGLNEKAEMRKRGGEYKQANTVVQGSFCLFMLWHIKKNIVFSYR